MLFDNHQTCHLFEPSVTNDFYTSFGSSWEKEIELNDNKEMKMNWMYLKMGKEWKRKEQNKIK